MRIPERYNNSQRPAVEQKRASVQLADISEDGTFSGYASVFGKVDLGKDKVERGAFRRSLAKRKTMGIRMLFQHDPSEPIGTWDEIREDETGLFVKGRIIQKSAKGAEVLNLMRAGAIDGLSIGFRTEKSRTDRKSGVRSILEADLWEISIVTFPMLPQARVAQVKSHTIIRSNALPSVREFERWLTQDAGLSRSEARTVIGKGFAQLASKRDAAGGEHAVLVDRVRRAAQTLSKAKYVQSN